MATLNFIIFTNFSLL